MKDNRHIYRSHMRISEMRSVMTIQVISSKITPPLIFVTDIGMWDLAGDRFQIMETWYRRLLLDNRNVTPGWLTRHCPDNHRPPPPPGLLIAPERPRRRETSCATRAGEPSREGETKNGVRVCRSHFNPFGIFVIYNSTARYLENILYLLTPVLSLNFPEG